MQIFCPFNPHIYVKLYAAPDRWGTYIFSTCFTFQPRRPSCPLSYRSSSMRPSSMFSRAFLPPCSFSLFIHSHGNMTDGERVPLFSFSSLSFHFFHSLSVFNIAEWLQLCRLPACRQCCGQLKDGEWRVMLTGEYRPICNFLFIYLFILKLQTWILSLVFFFSLIFPHTNTVG